MSSRALPDFISFEEFERLVAGRPGLLLFVITAKCDAAARRNGRRVQQAVGAAAVHLMCAELDRPPTIVFYEGGDARPLLQREGPTALDHVARDCVEASRIAVSRPTVIQERASQERLAEQTASMLASERLGDFPSFFQMARGLARDAWYAARRSAEGAPLLLDSPRAAARLRICGDCPSLRGDRCVECGCNMYLKAHLAAMRCPVGKWQEEEK